MLEIPRYRIAIDLPGHGGSSAIDAPPEMHFDLLVAALDPALRALAPDGFDLWGYSMGGRVALAYALSTRAPGLRRLILESASPGLESAEERTARREADDALAASLEREGLAPFVERWEALPLFATERKLPATVQAEIRAGRLAQDPHRLASALRGLSPGRQTPLWDRLAALQVPTLLVTGVLDARYQAIARRMQEGLPRALHLGIPGAGHAPHRERPEATAEAIAPFLATTEEHP
jgi:2-succinyl-6-hydroxy-2,4-cyclohexadiene-1-carboxylate synthase